MPLLDHFHPPLSERRPWESFHATWASTMADALNQGILPSNYIALEQVHAGANIEIEVATYDESGAESAAGSTATVAAPRVWTPATAPIVLPAAFPESCTVEIHATDGGRTLVASIELVSPGNKDRAFKRRLFAAKCATYLARGVGLVIVDVVTSRQGNLHNEMVTLLGLDPGFQMPGSPSLYATAYRPLRQEKDERIDSWLTPLAVGDSLPSVPLSLAAELCVPVDLEATYRDTCRRRHVDEVLS
jgi:hypothetical protein